MKSKQLKDIFSLKNDSTKAVSSLQLSLDKIGSILMPWLSEVSDTFQLLPETYFLTTLLFARFLQKKYQTLKKGDVQLYGCACSMLAQIIEEIERSELGDYVYITDNAYNRDQIRTATYDVLEALDYDLYAFSSVYDCYTETLHQHLSPEQRQLFEAYLTLISYQWRLYKYDNLLVVTLLSVILFDNDFGLSKRLPTIALAPGEIKGCLALMLDLTSFFQLNEEPNYASHRYLSHMRYGVKNDEIKQFFSPDRTRLDFSSALTQRAGMCKLKALLMNQPPSPRMFFNPQNLIQQHEAHRVKSVSCQS